MSISDLLSTDPTRYTPGNIERRRRSATAPERELAKRLRTYAEVIAEDADRLLGPGHPDRAAFMARLSELVGEPGLCDLSHALDGGPRDTGSDPAAQPAATPAQGNAAPEAGAEGCSSAPAEPAEEDA